MAFYYLDISSDIFEKTYLIVKLYAFLVILVNYVVDIDTIALN